METKGERVRVVAGPHAGERGTVEAVYGRRCWVRFDPEQKPPGAWPFPSTVCVDADTVEAAA